MNKARYDGLPAELKAVIDANSGAGRRRHGRPRLGRRQRRWCASMVAKRGNTITTLPPEEKARWRAATEPVIERLDRPDGGDGPRRRSAARRGRARLVAKYAAA